MKYVNTADYDEEDDLAAAISRIDEIVDWINNQEAKEQKTKEEKDAKEEPGSS